MDDSVSSAIRRRESCAQPRIVVDGCLPADQTKNEPGFDNGAERSPDCVLFFETETVELLLQAIDRVSREKPGVSIQVVCKAGSVAAFSQHPSVREVLVYRGLRERIKLIARMWPGKRRVLGAVLSPRAVFWFHRLLFHILPAAERWVFTEELEKSRLRPLKRIPSLLVTVPWALLRGHLFPAHKILSVLLLETGDVPAIDRALDLLSRKIAPWAKITLLCDSKCAPLFSGDKRVEKLITYDSSRLMERLRILFRREIHHSDLVVAYLTQSPVFYFHRLLFGFTPWARKLAFNRHGDCLFVARVGALPRALWSIASSFCLYWVRRLILRPVSQDALFLQTSRDKALHSAVKVAQDLVEGKRIEVVCGPGASTHLATVKDKIGLTLAPGSDRLFGWLRLLRRLRRVRWPFLIAHLPGHRGRPLAKLAFFLIPARKRLVFNEHGDCYLVRKIDFPWFLWFLSTRYCNYLWRKYVRRPAREEILVLPTGSRQTVGDAVQMARSVVPDIPVHIVCGAEDARHFLSLEGVARVTCLPSAREHSRRFALVLKLRRMRRNTVVGMFPGSRNALLGRLAFILLFARQRLVVNENRDCFFLRPSRLHRLLQLPEREPVEVTFFHTERSHDVLLGIARFAEYLGRPLRTTVLCPVSRKAEYADRPGVDRVLSYRRPLALPLLIWWSIRLRADYACAFFTGRPVFRTEKLAFLLSPARRRMAFNANLDFELIRWWRGVPERAVPARFRVALLTSREDDSLACAIRSLRRCFAPRAEITVLAAGEQDQPHLGEADGQVLLKNMRFRTVRREINRLSPDFACSLDGGPGGSFAARLALLLSRARTKVVVNHDMEARPLLACHKLGFLLRSHWREKRKNCAGDLGQGGWNQTREDLGVMSDEALKRLLFDDLVGVFAGLTVHSPNLMGEAVRVFVATGEESRSVEWLADSVLLPPSRCRAALRTALEVRRMTGEVVVELRRRREFAEIPEILRALFSEREIEDLRLPEAAMAKTPASGSGLFSELGRMSSRQWILDLGSGGGSFDYDSTPARVVSVDLAFASPSPSAAACLRADAGRLPFASETVDIVICNNSMEHFEELGQALSEIDRVVKPGGWMWASVPDFRTLDDRLYRFLYKGGGHVNRFRRESFIETVEGLTRFTAQRSKKLQTGLVYLKAEMARNWLHFPKRTQLALTALPAETMDAVRRVFHYSFRWLDHHLGLQLSAYGWAVLFQKASDQARGDRQAAPVIEASEQVCCGCGRGFHTAFLQAIADSRRRPPRYRCPGCGARNFLFVIGDTRV